jgi:ABC-type hemin transport system ATPase subunit
MLIATHDLELADSLTPRTIILNRGKIVAGDTSTRILHDEALLVVNGLR